MKKRSVATGFAVLLLFVMVSTALAAPGAANVPLPFKGSIQAVETSVVQPPTLYVDANGSGNATHLGRYAVSYQVEVFIPTRVGIASLTFVAANGDSIFADGLGQASASGTPGVNRIAEDFTITGGTGRFAGASGSFHVERLVTMATGVSSGTFDGNIVMP